MSNNMVDIYVKLIQRGLRTLESVPDELKIEVEMRLAGVLETGR